MSHTYSFGARNSEHPAPYTISSDDIQLSTPPDKNEVPETPLKLRPSVDDFVYSSNDIFKQGTRRLLSNSRFKDISSMRDKHMVSKTISNDESFSPFENSESSSASPISLSRSSSFLELDSLNFKDEPILPARKKKRLVRKADLKKRQQDDECSEKSLNEVISLESSTRDSSPNFFDVSPSLSKDQYDEENVVVLSNETSPPSNPLHDDSTLKLDSALNFFNSASTHDVINTTQCSLAQAELLVSLRPFSNFNMLRESIQATKGLSSRMIETYLSVTDSISALDELIFKCNTIQARLTNLMESWPTDLPQPSSLAMELKNYQRFGVAWLGMLYEEGISGCILADEMGLGKTAQVIAMIASLTERQIPGPHLIISPASTLEHWIREFSKWLPSCSTYLYHGNHIERKHLQYDIKELMPDVIITAYHTASNSKDDRVFLRKLKCNLVVLDEGHKVKNTGSQTNRHLAKIPSQFRLLLTGTPLQNNLHELVSLLTFILPDVFESKCDWQKMLNLKSIDAVSQKLILKVKCLLQPFILRRKKNQVLQDLPPKQVHVVPCSLEKEQKDFYRSIQNDACHDTTSQQRIQHYLMTLRKAAVHPLLFRLLYTETKVHEMAKKLLREEPFWGTPLDVLVEDLMIMSDFQLHSLALKYKSGHSFALQNKEWMYSSKFVQLQPLLSSFNENGDRCLIFSQFTMCLDILEAFLNELNYKYVRLDGSTPIEERQYLVDTFNETSDIFIFLLSTKAGGLGLNLTAANIVIFHDLDFNPHNDTQAEDRAWRLGQTKPVHVYKLVCQDTVEEIIYKRQLAKLELDYQMTNEDDVGLLKDENFKADFLKHVALSQDTT